MGACLPLFEEYLYWCPFVLEAQNRVAGGLGPNWQIPSGDRVVGQYQQHLALAHRLEGESGFDRGHWAGQAPGIERFVGCELAHLFTSYEQVYVGIFRDCKIADGTDDLV